MPYCSQCATAYETGAHFCSNCGASVSAVASRPAKGARQLGHKRAKVAMCGLWDKGV
jgi:hypothetical protein